MEGPCKYLDLGFCFFLIRIPEFELNKVKDPSSRRACIELRIRIILHMSPFLLNLNLKPLYSRRGGSTTRTEPLTNPLTVVERRLKPLYR